MKRKKAPDGSGFYIHGYKMVQKNRIRIFEHRLIMQNHIGRKLLPEERVHHKDGNKLNNNIENLELLPSQSVHARLHRTRLSTPTHKQCSRCDQIKERSEFYLQSRTKTKTRDSHRYECKDCCYKMKKEEYWRSK